MRTNTGALRRAHRGRLGAPPAAPVILPLTTDWTEHVAAHDVRTARAHQPAGSDLVGFVCALVSDVSTVKFQPAFAERMLETLV